MLCEQCNHNNATTIVTKTINGATTTTHMCAECAFKAGYSNIFGNFTLNHIMSELDTKTAYPQKKCAKCGATFQQLLSSGKIGCSYCYHIFENELIPTIQKIHGKALHVGKRPHNKIKEQQPVDLLEELKQRLDKAIEKQEFETAAILRDEINKMKDKNE